MAFNNAGLMQALATRMGRNPKSGGQQGRTMGKMPWMQNQAPQPGPVPMAKQPPTGMDSIMAQVGGGMPQGGGAGLAQMLAPQVGPAQMPGGGGWAEQIAGMKGMQPPVQAPAAQAQMPQGMPFQGGMPQQAQGGMDPRIMALLMQRMRGGFNR
jgi:hypothetical protein